MLWSEERRDDHTRITMPSQKLTKMFERWADPERSKLLPKEPVDATISIIKVLKTYNWTGSSGSSYTLF